MARFMNEKLSACEPTTLYRQTDTEALSSDPSYGLHNYTPVLWNDNINYSKFCSLIEIISISISISVCSGSRPFSDHVRKKGVHLVRVREDHGATDCDRGEVELH